MSHTITETPPPPSFKVNFSSIFNNDIKLSPFAEEGKQQKFILFNRVPEEILTRLKESNYNELLQFNRKSPVDSFDEICELIDSLSEEELLKTKKKLLIDFQSYIKVRIPNKTSLNLTSNWPPQVPRLVAQVDLVLNLLIRLCLHSKSPEKFLFWLTNTIYPKQFTSTSCLINSKICAICRCIIPPDKKAYWAVLDNDHIFKLYLLRKSGTELDYQGEVSRIRLDEDQQSIILTDTNNIDVRRIMPVDINQAQMWGAALNRQHSPFPYFFSSYQIPLPQEYYPALFEAITSCDLIIPRCVAHPTVTPPEEYERSYELMEALLDCYAHLGRVSSLLQVLVSLELTLVKDSFNWFRSPSNLGILANIFFARYGKPYFDNFVQKLLDYVNSKDVFAKGLNANPDAVKVPLFTALKLIYSSGGALTPEIKHFSQVLFAYSAIKFNKKQDVLNVLANFYLSRLILGTIQQPEVYGSQTQKSPNLKGFIDIMKVVFSFGSFSGHLEPLNERLQKNVYPKFQLFLLNASKPTAPEPSYEPVTQERYTKMIESVLRAIAFKKPGQKGGSFIQFVQRFNEAAQADFHESLPIFNNLHYFIAQFFSFRTDEDIVQAMNNGEDVEAPMNYFEEDKPKQEPRIQSLLPPAEIIPAQPEPQQPAEPQAEVTAGVALKKSAGKKAAGKKAAPAKGAGTAKKAAGKKAAPKKAAGTAKGAGTGTAKKAAGKKTAPKKAAGKKAAPKKAADGAAPKKAAPKKAADGAAPKKAAPKKAADGAAPKKAPAKKGAKKAAGKKAAPKKA
ncbi:GTPase activation domain, GAP family [Trichomonas vaginalis G3]|nr:GTPase activation domain, GAP family [Trichomonas vaginalis G3]KAI5548270.1 GTPase activation domain, GAP family [Trichomonas vaginalis G3]